MHNIKIASPTGRHTFFVDLHNADASIKNLIEERPPSKQYRPIGHIIEGDAPTTLATDDKWNAIAAGTNDIIQIHAPVDRDNRNFVTEITTEMVEAGMIKEHVSMLLRQSMTDELLGHSSDKV